jgi:hypothetical protein
MVNRTISTGILCVFGCVCFMASIKFTNNATKMSYDIKLREKLHKDYIAKMLLDVV